MPHFQPIYPHESPAEMQAEDVLEDKENIYKISQGSEMKISVSFNCSRC